MTIVQSASDAGEATPAVLRRAPAVGGPYARFVLGVMTLVYVLNMVDRYILSVLAERIKADFGVSDAQIGFLYGTAFAVFFAVFGIPLGRVADATKRTRLISVGIAFWSLMTMLSGMARSFGALALCRFGVGIGESSASPAANSLLSDYFPPSVRATVISIYSSGTAIGAGLGLILGGAILDGWAKLFPDPAMAPLGLKGWQAAFLGVGLPGLLLSLLVATLREPERGQTEAIVSADAPSAWRVLAAELMCILPPLPLIRLLRSRDTWRSGALNIAAAGGLAIAAAGLTAWLGSPLQWAALAFGVYCAGSWAQSLASRDRPAFDLMFRSRAFVISVIAFPLIAFSGQAMAFWSVPFLIRAHGVTASQAGAWVGIGAAIGGWAGVTVGGVLADGLQHRVRGSRHVVGIIAVALLTPASLVFLSTGKLWAAVVMTFAIFFTGPMALGPSYCVVIDLVLPRMRGAATALAAFMNAFLGLSLGPYVAGRLSDAFVAAGVAPAEGLRRGMMLCLIPGLATCALLLIGRASLQDEMTTKIERARALGESI